MNLINKPSLYLCVFVLQVNGVNVVKVGHKQVVSLIRQGGNRLLMKVVSVTRKPESDEVVRKKGKVWVINSIKQVIIPCKTLMHV